METGLFNTATLRHAGLAVLGLILTWLVAAHSLSAALVDKDPELALRLNASSPAALLTLAERELDAVAATATGNDRPSPSHSAGADASAEAAAGAVPLRLHRLATIRSVLGEVLTADPLNSRAIAALGRAAELIATSPAIAEDQAIPIYELASRISVRESRPRYRLMQWALERGDFDRALVHLDTLLRTHSTSWKHLFPVLARLGEIPDVKDRVHRLIAQQPPPYWRHSFLLEAPSYVADARTPLAFFLALKSSSSPPTSSELKPYLTMLVGKGHHQLAYYAWLQFLPPSQVASLGLLFNGGFEIEPDGLPFDWGIPKGAGFTADVARLHDDPSRRALRIDFDGSRASFDGIHQSLVLAPGAYVLTGRMKGTLAGRRGLRWRLVCLAPGPQKLAETDMAQGNMPTWRSFRLDFTVPDTACTAQQVRLDLDARSASERIVRGTMWFDDLKLSRQRRVTAAR